MITRHATAALMGDGDLVEWPGCRRWLAPAEAVRRVVNRASGCPYTAGTMSALPDHRGARVFLGLTTFVIVTAGMKAADELILPILTALFLSLLCIPPMRRMERLGLPRPLALVAVVGLATLLVLVVLAVIGDSITEFQERLPEYQERLDSRADGLIDWLRRHGVEIKATELRDSIDSGAILRLVSDTATSLLSALSNLLLVLLTMVFMLLEANTLPNKLRLAMNDPEADLSDFSKAAHKVQEYLAIKATLSLATGALVAILCWACGVDFPLLWALIAFLFNFVPNIGSIIAAVPAVLLTLVQLGPAPAAIVAIGYLAINMVVGNVVEPRWLGRKLGLSTLVVFLSMLFWGWVWGPLGMLLSVPLTVVVKLLFEHSDDLRWVAVLLGPGDDSDSHLAPDAVPLPTPAAVIAPGPIVEGDAKAGARAK